MCTIHPPVTSPTLFYGECPSFHGGILLTIRIAYFSWKGHTQKVATALAKVLNAELVRIEPVQESGMAIKAMKAILSMRSPIRPCKTDLAGIDELIIATPVWAGKVPPYVNEYLSAVTGGGGKPFHVIAEMGGRGSEGAIATVKKQLEKNGMRFGSSAATVECDVDSGAYMATVEKFAAGIKKT
jgi:menaquinone-dependent protoporphyrinogen IX oxidase